MIRDPLSSSIHLQLQLLTIGLCLSWMVLASSSLLVKWGAYSNSCFTPEFKAKVVKHAVENDNCWKLTHHRVVSGKWPLTMDSFNLPSTVNRSWLLWHSHWQTSTLLITGPLHTWLPCMNGRLYNNSIHHACKHLATL